MARIATVVPKNTIRNSSTATAVASPHVEFLEHGLDHARADHVSVRDRQLVGQQPDHLEGLHAADDHEDDGNRHDFPDQGQGEGPELAPLRGAVDAGGLVDALRYTLHGGEKEHHVEATPPHTAMGTRAQYRLF